MWTGTLPVTWTIRAATSPAFNLGFHPSSSSHMRAAISPPCWLSFLSAFFILCCVAFRDRKTPATQETRQAQQPSNPTKPARFWGPAFVIRWHITLKCLLLFYKINSCGAHMRPLLEESADNELPISFTGTFINQREQPMPKEPKTKKKKTKKNKWHQSRIK